MTVKLIQPKLPPVKFAPNSPGQPYRPCNGTEGDVRADQCSQPWSGAVSDEKLRYAGVGSRQTPTQIRDRMFYWARELAALKFVLRSGAADGADMAFEAGCDSLPGAEKEIWLPWRLFNHYHGQHFLPSIQHFRVASDTHPAWGSLTWGPRALHARNIGQVLGHDLLTRVQFVLCWTPDGCETHAERTRSTGGTGTAISVASNYGIQVFNLRRERAEERFTKFVDHLIQKGKT